jgi:hypothetical protein
VFNPRGIFYALDLRDGSIDLGSVADRDSDLLGFLDRLWQIPTDCNCVGFKMTRGQTEQILECVLEDLQIKKLLLGRRNRVKTLVSELIAEQTDQWELHRPNDRVEPPKIRVGVNQLHDHAAENKVFYDTVLRSLESSNQPHVELEYEKLGSRQEQSRILEFLGVAATGSSLAPASVKQTQTDLRAVISNFAELDSALSGTDYHCELHDLGH